LLLFDRHHGESHRVICLDPYENLFNIKSFLEMQTPLMQEVAAQVMVFFQKICEASPSSQFFWKKPFVFLVVQWCDTYFKPKKLSSILVRRLLKFSKYGIGIKLIAGILMVIKLGIGWSVLFKWLNHNINKNEKAKLRKCFRLTSAYVLSPSQMKKRLTVGMAPLLTSLVRKSLRI